MTANNNFWKLTQKNLSFPLGQFWCPSGFSILSNLFIKHKSNRDFFQSPDDEFLDRGDPLRALLQHHALQGVFPQKSGQRQVRPLQGSRGTSSVRRVGWDRAVPRLRFAQAQADRMRPGRASHPTLELHRCWYRLSGSRPGHCRRHGLRREVHRQGRLQV